MLRRMLRRASRSPPHARDRAMILLSVKAGLRACEIARLDWSMVLDARGKVADVLAIQDAIAKKRGGRRIPMHPDLRRALQRLLRASEPSGPVIRSARGGYPRANQRGQLVCGCVQRTRLRRVLIAFRPAHVHHWRRSQRPPLGLRPAHSRRHLYVTSYTEGFSHFVASMTAPVASGWSGWPGGACTRWKAPPCHGAHVKRTLRKAGANVANGREGIALGRTETVVPVVPSRVANGLDRRSR